MVRNKIFMGLAWGVLLFVSHPSCRQGEAPRTTESLDSLYLGYRFGMSLEDFFAHCRDMNRAGILYEGDTYNTVTQEIEEFEVSARIYIKPEFDESEGLYQLDLLFQYNVLPMFRPDLTPVKLREEVLDFMEAQLGGELKPKEHPILKRVWEQVEGHRRVRLYHEGEKINVEYYDLRHQVTG